MSAVEIVGGGGGFGFGFDGFEPEEVVGEVGGHEVAFVVVDGGGAAEEAVVEEAFDSELGVAFGLGEVSRISGEGVEVDEEAEDAGVDVGADDLVGGRGFVGGVPGGEVFGEF